MFTVETADTGPHRPQAASDAGARSAMDGVIDVKVANRIEDVEVVWRTLTAGSIESPGQSYDFIRLWVADRKLAAEDQRYVVGRIDGHAVALLPLHRKRVWGVPILTWFPGANAGCYAPIADYAALAALGPDRRRALWGAMTRALGGADVVFLRMIPAETDGHAELFDELGTALPVETLYRSQYASWADCDRLQRSRSRRKHDRQQGDRLMAMGEVDFAELRNGDAMDGAIDTMFRQRSARFKAMGIRDIFVCDGLTGFYHQLAQPDSGVEVRLHVLRLNGEIVAVRYNIVHGDRMFCLISSMSDDAAIQNGSPGKQCLLRVMQTVFDGGIGVFDMGGGFTDEKRHWCNVQTPLRHHYIGLTPQGALIAKAHQAFQRMRAGIKNNQSLKTLVREARQVLGRVQGRRGPAAGSEPSD